MLPPLLAALPGVADANSLLASEQWRQPLLDHIEQLAQPPESLHLARSLDAPGAEPTAATTAQVAVERPTHLLTGHRVTSLDAGLSGLSGVTLTVDADQLVLGGSAATSLRVNDSPARSGQVLVPGDTLTAADGFHATLVIVED